MKRILLLTLFLLTALLVLFVSCGGDSDTTTSPFTTVQDTAPPLPDVDHNVAVRSEIDYAFVYGSFVKSSYNGADNPTSRVYLDPTSMKPIPLSFHYEYRDDGILDSLKIGEGANTIPLSVKYNSQGIPAERPCTEVRVISHVCDKSFCSRGDIEIESCFLNSLAETFQFDVNDLLDAFL